jgi:hypothetical protein
VAFAGKQVFEVFGIYVESSLMGDGSCSNHGYCFGQWRSKHPNTFTYLFLLRIFILIMVLNCGCGCESLHCSEMWSMQLRCCCLNLEMLYIATAIVVVKFKTMILILKCVDAYYRTKTFRNSCRRFFFGIVLIFLDYFLSSYSLE